MGEDLEHNGDVFDIDFSDLPAKKNDLAMGTYEFNKRESGKRIAVKIIDMLGEEVLEVVEL